MELDNSVVAELCENNLLNTQIAKTVVTVSVNDASDNEDKKYFVVTDMAEDQSNQMEMIKEEQTTNQSITQISWSEICRTCANVSDHLIPIFEEEGLQNGLSHKIQKHLPIQVSQNDFLPLQLCYQCAATLLAWHELSEGCLSSEQKLQEIYQALQEKHQYLDTSCPDELDASQEAVIISSLTESDAFNQGTSKEQNNSEPLHNDSDRSGFTRTSFRMLLDMQNAFWKAFKKKVATPEKKFPNSANCDALWITMMEYSMDQSATISDHLQINNIKSGVTDHYDDGEKSEDEDRGQEQNDILKVKAKNRAKSKCEDCGSGSTDMKNTCEHRKKRKIEIRSSYQCDDCGKCFKLKDSYVRHMRIHRDERPFTCHVCGKQFRDSGGLSRHLKDVHAKVKKFTCDICGKSFASKATREDHRRTHTGERPYICDSCGKTFKSKACLYTHSKLHTDEYPHPCSHCNKKFRRRQEMLAHITTHTGEKNYGCDVCSKRFRVKSELVRHKLVHSESKPFVCVKCGLAFRQKRYLNNHIKSRHTEISRTY